MARKLIEAYVEDHMQYIENSAQVMGSKIADLILRSVHEHIKKNGESESVKLNATVEVKAFQDVCVDVQMCLPFVGCSSVHIGV